MIQQTDEVAANRIIILGCKIQADLITEIFQVGGAENHVFTVAKLDNRIFFVSIVLITDFTNNLFQKIFQRDQTRSSTILIQNNGK